MKAFIMAAGIGKRLGTDNEGPPKCLLEFSGKTLLQRHFDILSHCGISEVVIGVGYRSDHIERAITANGNGIEVSTVFNPDYEKGSVITLKTTLADHLPGDEEILLMDADVLYDHRLLQRLLASGYSNCFLMDRDYEPGEEPVKLCVRENTLVEFRKQVDVDSDFCGESVGFFRLRSDTAQNVINAASTYIDAGDLDTPYEEALRDVLLSAPADFGFEDITGLPWTEIDFPEDVVSARENVLPGLEEIIKK